MINFKSKLLNNSIHKWITGMVYPHELLKMYHYVNKLLPELHVYLCHKQNVCLPKL